MIQYALQSAACDLGAVGELEGACRSIARIGKGSLLVQDFVLVQRVKGGIRHQYFAPYLYIFGIVSFEGVRYIADFEGVFCDIIALGAVSAGERHYELAFMVAQAYGGAVELEFATI